MDDERHDQVLRALQRLRGSVYLQDGAIERSQLTFDGRHALEVDNVSWHVVSLHDGGDVAGCARFRAHDAYVRPEVLAAWRSPLASDILWRPWLRRSLESEIKTARLRHQSFVEVGGWAIGEEWRFTPEALDVALSTYALARTLGGCIGITTATVRNHSSRILRKLGGRPLELDGCSIPSYYDPHYRCEMEILRFDSAAPNPRYEAHVERIAAGFVNVPVLCGAPAAAKVLRLQPTRATAPRFREAYA